MLPPSGARWSSRLQQVGPACLGVECVPRAALGHPGSAQKVLGKCLWTEANKDAGGGEGGKPGGAAASSTPDLETLPPGLARDTAVLGRACLCHCPWGLWASPLFLSPSADSSSPCRVETLGVSTHPCCVSSLWNVLEHARTRGSLLPTVCLAPGTARTCQNT